MSEIKKRGVMCVLIHISQEEQFKNLNQSYNFIHQIMYSY